LVFEFANNISFAVIVFLLAAHLWPVWTPNGKAIVDAMPIVVFDNVIVDLPHIWGLLCL